MKKLNNNRLISFVLIILISLCISSCGLFRKSSRVDTNLQRSEVNRTVDVKTNTTNVEIDQKKDNSITTTNEGEKVKVYPKKDGSITILPDGTITGQVDSIIRDVKRTTKEARNIITEAKKSLQQTKDSTNKSKEETQQKTKIKEKESRPDMLGTIAMYIGIGILIIALIWAIRKFIIKK